MERLHIHHTQQTLGTTLTVDRVLKDQLSGVDLYMIAWRFSSRPILKKHNSLIQNVAQHRGPCCRSPGIPMGDLALMVGMKQWARHVLRNNQNNIVSRHYEQKILESIDQVTRRRQQKPRR
jgi:hypothetical protein